MRNATTVFMKQIKETFKNKAILIHFVLLPAMALILENTVKLDNMPDKFFVKLFAVMFVGMAPLTCMSSIVAEEKEQNTLRALLMSNVKPVQYLSGVGVYVWLMCMLSSLVFALCGRYHGTDLLLFMIYMGIGNLLSLMIGAVIGICSKKQMTATSVSLPVMMIFSFLPMLSMFNQTIEKVARFTYSQQINILINGIGIADIEPESIAVIAANFLITVIIFCIAFKKKGLE